MHNVGVTFSPEYIMEAIFVLLKVIVIIVVAKILLRLSKFFVEKLFVEPPVSIRGVKYNAKRVQTLKSLTVSVIRYTLYFLAVTMILEEFGFPVASLLAGAGVLGLAVGFGAQNLVRDVITGFFILAENQFSVGEHVKIGTIEGIVEEIGIRTTKIKAFEGQIHIVPNGEISLVTNYSSTQSIRILFDVSIAYEADMDQAIAVLEQVCQDFAVTNEKLVEGPKVLGVQTLGDYGVQIRILGRSVPGEQWTLERALKRKIKETLDREGIEIPYPKQVFLMKTMQEKNQDEHKQEAGENSISR